MANYEESRWTSFLTAQSLTDAWSSKAITRDAAAIHIESIDFTFTSVTTTTTFSWYLSIDEAGALPVTDLVTGQTLNAAKPANTFIASAMIAKSIGGGKDPRAKDTLYLHVKSDQSSGTATFAFYVNGMFL